MRRHNTERKFWIGIPPWVILGAMLVLLPIFVFMTIENIHRQNANTTELLLEKGAALIRSFEAGARTGMMGMMGTRWGGNQIQRLLAETAQQPDIAYIMVTDVKGTILADSDPAMIGRTHGSGLDLDRISCSNKIEWRQVSRKDAPNIFEVFRQFSPTRGYGQRFRDRAPTNDWCQPLFNGDSQSGGTGQVIFVGLDMGPIEAARQEDMRHTVVMAMVFLLIGFAGIVSLFLAQAYRTTRTSLSRVKAFSDKLVENMPIGLLAIDTEDRVVSFNQTAEAVLNISGRDVWTEGSGGPP